VRQIAYPLVFGLSSAGGVGAALLGLADLTRSLSSRLAFLPAIGLLTAFLPNIGRPPRPA